MTVQADEMTTRELNELLHTHFIRPEDRISEAGAGAVYLTEVTAPNSSRRADVVHIGLWQNRGGGRIDVCELKTSRGDWLRELENPAKAEAWWPYCNAWWLVVPNADIVQEGELPPGWGLMVPGSRGRRFKVIVKPEERKPELTVGLLRTLLTNTETTKIHALRQQRVELEKRHSERMDEMRRNRGDLSPKDRARLALLDRLEERLGMKLEDYAWEGRLTPETAAEGLKVFMRGLAAVENTKKDGAYIVRELDRAAKGVQQQADELRRVLAGLKEGE
jgi:hypothetical protein